jgi:Tfp pilus assembly protein PilO
MPPQPEPWHLSRSVPLALIVTLAIQTAGMVWWASSLTAQVQEQSRRLAALESSRDQSAAILNALRSDVAVLRADAATAQRQLDRIVGLLDRRAEAPGMTDVR